jgi:hypothetical protein
MLRARVAYLSRVKVEVCPITRDQLCWIVICLLQQRRVLQLGCFKKMLNEYS